MYGSRGWWYRLDLLVDMYRQVQAGVVPSHDAETREPGGGGGSVWRRRLVAALNLVAGLAAYQTRPTSVYWCGGLAGFDREVGRFLRTWVFGVEVRGRGGRLHIAERHHRGRVCDLGRQIELAVERTRSHALLGAFELRAASGGVAGLGRRRNRRHLPSPYKPPKSNKLLTMHCARRLV